MRVHFQSWKRLIVNYRDFQGHHTLLMRWLGKKSSLQMLSKLRMDLKDHCLPSLRNYSLIKDLCKGFQDTFMWKINHIKGPRASAHHIFYWRFPFLILVNVSFTEEFLKVTASLALRILNPKVDASLTSFFFFFFFSQFWITWWVSGVQWSFSEGS